jgi:hypothetical protein
VPWTGSGSIMSCLEPSNLEVDSCILPDMGMPAQALTNKQTKQNSVVFFMRGAIEPPLAEMNRNDKFFQGFDR